MKNLLRQFHMVGGVDFGSGTLFFAIGDWFHILGGIPDRNSIYVRLFGQEIHK